MASQESSALRILFRKAVADPKAKGESSAQAAEYGCQSGGPRSGTKSKA